VSTDQTGLRLVREALEGVLAPEVVSQVMFEALEAQGDAIPSNEVQLVAFARGPLHKALLTRLGMQNASVASEHVVALLEAARMKRPPPPLPPSASVSRNRGEPTLALPAYSEPVEVMVVAGGGAMVSRLDAALGSGRVSPWAAIGVDDVRAGLRDAAPAIVLVDAADVPAVDVWTLASLLAAAPATAVCVVWGVELPFGRRLVQAARSVGAEIGWLSRRDGVEPLLDLIRSRQTK